MGNLFLLRALITGSQSGSSHLQGFFGNVYTNPKSFRTSCDIQASLLSIVWETDLPLYTWGPVYYRDRFLTETHSEPSVSHLPYNRNRDSSIEIGPWQKPTLCSDLVWDDLITLLVWVDKENSIEFSFAFCTILIHILYLLLFTKFHISLLSHPLLHPLIF